MNFPQSDLPIWMVQTFRSFRSKNYRTYFISQLFSNCGSWIQLTVISWLILELTGSAFMLGLVNFLRLSPITLLGFLGGWLADRYDRKKILIVTKLAMFTQATALGLLTLSGHLEVWHVLVLATLLGISNAIDMPAKQSITFNLVKKEDLINAVSLNTSSFHASRAVGPVLAILIVFLIGKGTGEGICFLLNGLSFLFVVLALSRISLNTGATSSNKQDGKDGTGYANCLSFVTNNLNVRTVFCLGAISSFLCMQYIVMMPVFAKSVLEREMDGYGILMSAAAVGSVGGAMFLAHRARSKDILKVVIAIASIMFALALIAFSMSENFILSTILAGFIGLFSTTQLSASNSLIQLEVDDSLRGRVISLWMISVVGLGPVGGILVGAAANVYGAPLAMALCGVLSFILCSITLIMSLRAQNLKRIEV